MNRRTVSAVLCALSLATLAVAQQPDETAARVPELDAFHTPIYAIWHEAWPAGNVAQLKGLLPDVQKAYAALSQATLPGILRDKKDLWNEKMKGLADAIEAYRASVAANDSAAVMQAAERVHMSYEMLVRTIRPALKELDAFHQTLYLLHHYDMPGRDEAKVRAAADTLAARMEALNGAVLPKRLEKRTEQFTKARANLSEAVAAFAAASRSGKPLDELLPLEEAVHGRYQVLEKVFE